MSEIRLIRRGGDLVIEGANSLTRDEFDRVMAQVGDRVERMDQGIMFAESNRHYRWNHISNALGQVYEEVTAVPVGRRQALINVPSDLENSPELTAISDAFASLNTSQMEKERAFRENVVLANEIVDQMYMSTLTGAVKITPNELPIVASSRPRVEDIRSNMPRFAEPPILPEEQIHIPNIRARAVPPDRISFVYDTGVR